MRAATLNSSRLDHLYRHRHWDHRRDHREEEVTDQFAPVCR